MSLPPNFLDELRNRLSIADVVGRKVMWDQRKSNQAKGDMWAPCPFHHEKTASFHVDDRKGYYYCFGCHAKGDALSFVRETENVSFMEAVEILAGEAGMQMPARDPKAAEKADRATKLVEVMEMAVQYFRLQLKTSVAGEARTYLQGRGLSEAALERWEIGFAPDAWQGLWDHLTAKNVPADMILAAGLAKPSQKGGKPYDTFRGRIIFPIRDARGRAIAFGGRAMDPNDNAKYLNSPETELFDKGRNLYNHKPAREAAGKGQPLIVAEGYMDVIALSEAGFTAAVAPLGTAVTDNQLALLWRIHPEPIIALDGDTAGLRAAMRLIDLTLPLLEAGKSLRFAIMPEGQDPDDLLRAQGPAAVQAVLDKAMPMVDLLWRRETEGQNFDSPERKAALDKQLRDKITLIKDPSVRSHYGQAIKDLRWQLFRAKPAGSDAGRGRSANRKWNAPEGSMSTTKSSFLVSAEHASQDYLREAVILAVLLRNPTALPEFEDRLERLDCLDPDHRALQSALLRHMEAAPDMLFETVEQDVGASVLEKLMGQPHVAITPPVRRPGDSELASLCLAEEFAKLAARRGHAREITEVMQDMADRADENLTWRLREAAEGLNGAAAVDTDDSADYDVGPNGAKMKRDERSAFDQLIDQISYGKTGKPDGASDEQG
ncbi:DNA primase [Nereida sp. MMG025]|uniref:DNA primase n=1 Tax=Nereida sp. MMG025 TaxID=2909981 RepID=UPI001F013688|nr:DNA primase [Nereida sp. MMG025]MCF6445133.1 DNA primase [Nereida sp. MMG025]